jgi:hypothetical protein
LFGVSDSDRFTLFRASEDGSGQRQLVAQGRFNFGAEYAERSGIVFTQTSEKELVNHIWRVDPDGSGLRRLTDGAGETLVHLSHDGRLLLFTKLDEPGKIFSLDPVAGGDPRVLASNSTEDVPRVSPDGRLVRYNEFVTIDGRALTRSVVLPAGGGEPVAKILLPPTARVYVWSPDSGGIDYVDRSTGSNLMRRRLAGGEPVQLTRFPDGAAKEIVWSWDGARLAMVRQTGPKCALWSVAPGKGAPKLLAEFRSGDISWVAPTLDSKRFLFSYDMASKDVVLISNFQ